MATVSGKRLNQTAVDVKAASGSSNVLDSGLAQAAVWVAELTALAGGTTPDVAFSWEHSPDNTTFYLLATEAALSATGFKQRTAVENTFRFLRVSWVTTGAPTTATANFHIAVGS